MILKPLCAFCREPLEVTTRDTAPVESCPRCGVKVIYDNPSNGRKAHDAIMAAVKDALAHPANKMIAKIIAGEVITTKHTPSTTLEDKDITVIRLSVDDGAGILFAFHPDELLTAAQIAEICGKSKQVVQTHLRSGEHFPNQELFRVKSTEARAEERARKGGMPLRVAPRKDVQAYMLMLGIKVSPKKKRDQYDSISKHDLPRPHPKGLRAKVKAGESAT